MTYILFEVFFNIFWDFFPLYIRKGHLRHQEYKNKQLKNNTLEFKNNFKPININRLGME